MPPQTPKDFEASERPTAPDLESFVCPKCDGKGEVTIRVETSTTHRAYPRKCNACGGLKKLSREQLAEYRLRSPK